MRFMRKTKIPIIAAVVAVIAAVCAVFFVSYGRNTHKMTADLYFINEDGTGIVSNPYTVRCRDDNELVYSVLERLRKGPRSGKLGAIMPRETRIEGVEYSGGDSLTVRFSEEFETDDVSKNVLSVYAVVKSLCSAADVSGVKVLVGGEPVKDRDNKPLGFISASDINLEAEEYRSEIREVVLYFSSADGKKLVPEKRKIKITDQQPIEQYIINELIKGTNGRKTKSLLSEKTVLVSADLEDNVCYLNFRSDFLKINEGKNEHEKLVIYSIVNSLTELKNISRVQFYMDGKRVENFGSMKIKDYAERNTSIIKTEEEDVR